MTKDYLGVAASVLSAAALAVAVYLSPIRVFISVGRATRQLDTPDSPLWVPAALAFVVSAYLSGKRLGAVIPVWSVAAIAVSITALAGFSMPFALLVPGLAGACVTLAPLALLAPLAQRLASVGRARWGVPWWVGPVLAVTYSALPFAPFLNPRGYPIQVDSIFYRGWLAEALRDPSAVFSAADGSRPLFLAALLPFALVFGPDAVAMYMSVPLSALYAYATYVFAREALGDGRMAGVAAAILPASPSFLAFLYGGFQANLAALSLMLLSLAWLSRRPIASLAASLAALWIHPWTWLQYVAAAALYALLTRSRIGAVYVSVNAVAGLVREWVGFGAMSAAETAYYSASADVAGLAFMFTVWLWGVLGLWHIYAIAILGAVSTKSPLLASTLLVSAPAFIALMGNAGVGGRVLINVPIHVAAAAAVASLPKRQGFATLTALLSISLVYVAWSVPSPDVACQLPWVWNCNG